MKKKAFGISITVSSGTAILASSRKSRRVSRSCTYQSHFSFYWEPGPTKSADKWRNHLNIWQVN